MTQRFATLPAPAFNAAIVCDHALRAFKSILGRYAWWQQVLFSALGASLLMLAAGWVGAVLLTTYSGWGEGVVVDKASAVTTPGVFVRYDAWYYLQIARDGYRADGNERAFFPLYPLVVRGLSRLANISLLWSGFLFSLSCFVGSALLLYRWTEAEHGARVARLATLIFCLFPMSFFHMAFYAEPLLLLTTAAFFYFAQRGHFMAAGVAICLAGATRGVAFLLAIPYVVEFLSRRDFGKRQWLGFLTGGLIAPLGFGAYYQYRGFHVEGGWGTHYDWPWLVLRDGLNAAFFGLNIDPDWFSRALVWQDLTYAVGALLIGLWAMRKMRWSPALFLLGATLFMWTLHGPDGYAFWSMPRRVAVLLPLYPALALVLIRAPRWMRMGALVLSALLLGLLATWFASGRWVA